MEKKVKRFLKTEFYKGKNAFARCTDMILGKVFALLMLFGAGFVLGLRIYSCAVFALSGTAIFAIVDLLIKKRKFEKFCTTYMQALGRELLLEKLSILPSVKLRRLFLPAFEKRETKKLEPYFGGYFARETFRFYTVISLHPTRSATVEEIRTLYSRVVKLGVKSVCMLSLGGFDEQAELFAEKLPIHFELLGKEFAFEVAEDCGICADEKEKNEAIEALYDKRKERRVQFKEAFFQDGKTKVYLIGGIMLSVWPIIVGFNAIYPVMSSLCFIMATRGFILDMKKKKTE